MSLVMYACADSSCDPRKVVNRGCVRFPVIGAPATNPARMTKPT
jgi:hypothetical protein